MALRIGAMMAVAPMFGAGWISWKFRIAMTVLLTLVVAPLIELSPPKEFEIVGAAANELMCGILLGIGIRLLVMALGLIGDLISQMSGWSFGQVVSEGAEASSPLGKLFSWTMVAIFIASGGVNQLVIGLLESFKLAPPGSVLWDWGLMELLTGMLHQSFELALRVSAPALVALLVATLLMAFIQRSAPTVNSFQVGFALKSVLAFAVASLVIARGPVLASNYFEPFISQVQQALSLNADETFGMSSKERP